MDIDKKALELLKKQEVVALSFSLGKDSLACLLLLIEHNITFVPFYFYHIPDLEFINDTIKYYEEKINIKIVSLPHPMLYDYIRHQDFQPHYMIEYMHRYNINRLDFDELIDVYFKVHKNYERDVYTVIGVRAGESFNRRKVVEKQGTINHKTRKISPIAYWSKSDVINYIYSKGVKLSDDYKIWRRSFDGLKYQFLFGVKQHYPNDYQRIKDFFPLIDIELYRYEKNKEYTSK